MIHYTKFIPALIAKMISWHIIIAENFLSGRDERLTVCNVEVVCVEMAPYKLLAIDASSHSLLMVDGPSGEILCEIAYPAKYSPTSLAITADRTKAFIPVVEPDGAGALFAVNLAAQSLYRLPVVLPHPAQFALSPEGTSAYLADTEGAIYSLDIALLSLKRWGQCDNSTCIGLAAVPDGICSAWEERSGGIIAVFSSEGKLLRETSILGIPTNISIDQSGRIIVPFTASKISGEGLAVLDYKKNGGIPAIATIQCPSCSLGHRAYPCYAALSPDGCTAYVVNEDSGSISVIDVNNARPLDWFTVGRSISSLHILPDSRFALASSNMFCDLCLIDLVNGRLLTYTDTARDILCHIIVMPH